MILLHRIWKLNSCHPKHEKFQRGTTRIENCALASGKWDCEGKPLEFQGLVDYRTKPARANKFMQTLWNVCDCPVSSAYSQIDAH